LSKKKLPYFKLYTADWLSSASIKLMTDLEELAYFRMLLYSWQMDGLPSDPERLKKLIGLNECLASSVQRMFNEDKDGKLRNARQELERSFSQKVYKQRVLAGKKSAEKRKQQSKDLTNVQRNMHNESEPEPEPEPNKKEKLKYSLCQKSKTSDEENDGGEKKKKKPKHNPDTYKYSPEHMELSVLLKELILDNHPAHRKITDRDLERWSNTVRLMVERDKRSLDEVREVIVWSQNDEFWKQNILSTPKLREKFDMLAMKMKNQSSLNRGNSGGWFDGD